MKLSGKLTIFAIVNRLIPHIQFLLKENDCLIVPGLGAFVVDTKSAHIQGNEVFPPQRTIGFNASLSHNDGMLVESVSRREGISYQQAQKAVTDSVDLMMSIYELTGELNIPRIGMFKRGTTGKKMIFKPDADSIANYKNYGLSAVSIKGYVENDSQVEETRSATILSVRRAVQWAAAIIVLFCLGLALTTPITFDGGNLYEASMLKPNIKITTGKTADIPLPETIADNKEDEDVTDENQVIAQEKDNIIEEITEPAQIDTPQWRRNLDDSYFLIIASFDTVEQAMKYMKNRPDEQLSILDYDNHVRVFASSGNSYSAAAKCMKDERFVALHPDGWVYKKQ